MTMYPIKFEIYGDNIEDGAIAILDSLDGDFFEIDIKSKLISHEELKELANLVEIAEKQLKEGIICAN